ncbi:ABC transporter permease subunit [Gammaproteobacteria bacterium AB-CW1]|uniref:ABC transporter permease subunit n=1 Tax=Natronospira elongata TaxID=3110268 RepID=A0AAP6JCI4_9GAMM|nr:ABC transporter permease subunit [Gammaproteobacteria bacterium AB-CW1]
MPGPEARTRLRRWRRTKDWFAKGFVAMAGIGVIISLATIFVYLFSEVTPLFKGADLDEPISYEMPGFDQAETLYFATDRHNAVGVRYTSEGQAIYFQPESGEVLRTEMLDIPLGVAITSFATGEPRTGLAAFGLSDGTALVVQLEYEITYPDNQRQVTPRLRFPLGEEPIRVAEERIAVRNIAVQEGGRGYALITETTNGALTYARYEARRHFMTDEVELTRSMHALPTPPGEISSMLVDITLRNLVIGDQQGSLHYYDIHRPEQARLVDSTSVVEGVEGGVTAMEYLLGTVSIIVGGADGSLTQWFLVRDEDNVRRLTRIREFDRHPGAITHIFPEYARKGFIVGDESGHVGVHYGTSARTLAMEQVSDQPIRRVAVSPRNNSFLFTDAPDRLTFGRMTNPHPEISFGALWNRVWYEGRDRPEYVWQSSSATDEFEPKFSFVPLSVGTLKAAFYAMLFAMPLAIMGAIYTAYFMTPRLRGVVKPTIEIMEALPTVILGFLAGLWMAPFVENNLPAVFSILILMPVFMMAAAFLWTRVLPVTLRERVPPGWEAAILVPVVLVVGYVCVSASPWVEVALFDGDMRQWFTEQGIAYDQRNALVVGFAMGFAVIPTIFSIAEDAVFNVPKHLTQGSLALGATPWQTMVGVVLLTASPGIFSGVMIGFGRAVGETMIVLMATGNSPVVNFNIFEGMRTLSANIAVEMGEAARGGTHYRILFLAALVLFMATFVLNTIAEIVRQRLRRKYSSL